MYRGLPVPTSSGSLNRANVPRLRATWTWTVPKWFASPHGAEHKHTVDDVEDGWISLAPPRDELHVRHVRRGGRAARQLAAKPQPESSHNCFGPNLAKTAADDVRPPRPASSRLPFLWGSRACWLQFQEPVYRAACHPTALVLIENERAAPGEAILNLSLTQYRDSGVGCQSQHTVDDVEDSRTSFALFRDDGHVRQV